MFWIQDNANPKAGRRAPGSVGRPGPPDRSNPRWSVVCAWDGHGLVDMDYVQPSPHERVCRFHHQQFHAWIEDVSKRKYRFEYDEDV